MVWSWERIPELVQRAFRIATSGRPGPVHLDFPSDVLYNGQDDTFVKLQPPERYRPIKQPVGNPELVEKAAEMLYNAEKPLIHAGMGVLRARAWNELRELAEYLGAVVTDHDGRKRGHT